MVDIINNFNKINSNLDKLNNMDININENTTPIEESLEKKKKDILSEIDLLLQDISKKKNERTDEYKAKVLKNISKITDDILKLIERINRYNGLFDRENREKLLRDLFDKKNKEFQATLQEKLNERETAESKYAISIEELKNTIENTKSSIPNDLQEKLKEIESKASKEELNELQDKVNALEDSLNKKANTEKVVLALGDMENIIIKIDKKYDKDRKKLLEQVIYFNKKIKNGFDIVKSIKSDVDINKNKINDLENRLKTLEALFKSFEESMASYSNSIQAIKDQNIPINNTLIQQNLQINIFGSGFIERFIEMLRQMYQQQNFDTSLLGNNLSELTNATANLNTKIVKYNSRKNNEQHELIEKFMKQFLIIYNNLVNLTTQPQSRPQPLLEGPTTPKTTPVINEFPINWSNKDIPDELLSTYDNNENQEKVKDINTLINGLNPFLKIYNKLTELDEFSGGQTGSGMEGGADYSWWKTQGSNPRVTDNDNKNMNVILNIMNDVNCNTFEKLKSCKIPNNLKGLVNQLYNDNKALINIKNDIIKTENSDNLVNFLQNKPNIFVITPHFRTLIHKTINPKNNETFESNKEKLLYNLSANFDEKIKIRKEEILHYLKDNYTIFNSDKEVDKDNFETEFNKEDIKNQILKKYEIPQTGSCSEIKEKDTISLLTCLIITIDRNWDRNISGPEMKAVGIKEVEINNLFNKKKTITQEEFIKWFLEDTTSKTSAIGLRLRKKENTQNLKELSNLIRSYNINKNYNNNLNNESLTEQEFIEAIQNTLPPQQPPPEEAEILATEEAERLDTEEAEILATEEAERLATEEAERLATEEAEIQTEIDKLEAERLDTEEAELQAEIEKIQAEEAERLAAEEAEEDKLEKEELRDEYNRLSSTFGNNVSANNILETFEKNEFNTRQVTDPNYNTKKLKELIQKIKDDRIKFNKKKENKKETIIQKKKEIIF